MQFLNQKKSFIFSVIFFVCSVLGFFFLYGIINDKKESTLLAQETWQIESSKRNDVRSLINSVKTTAGERALLDTYFIRSSNVVPFLDTIERLAKEVNVGAEVTSVDIAKDNSSLLVGMKATGGFQMIYKFINLLENSQYILEFISVDIQNSSTTVGKTSQWTADFKIKLLSFNN
ncbi:MAG: hypothetical protein WCS86_02455 [Candidatus Paceibacterota bacterium]